MAGLTYVNDTNATTSSTTTTTATNTKDAHASTLSGDLLVAPFVSKPSGTAVATPSGGYNATTQRTVGTGTSSDLAGLLRVGLFWRFLTASPTSPIVSATLTATGAMIAIGAATWRPDAVGGWTIEVTDSVGSDTSSDTSFSATGATILPYIKDDWLVAVVALTNNVVTQASTDAISGTAPAGVSGATFNNWDSKWNTAGNGGTAGFGARSQMLATRCTGGLATTAPSIAATLDVASTGGAVFYRLHPVHLPWHILGIDGTSTGNFMKLQAARDGAGAVYEETQAQIVAGYYEAPYFYGVDTDQDWVRFQVRIDGPNTGGTAYARSELREMGTNGTSDAAWNSASGQHRMRGRLRWADLTPNKPTCVGAQIHDSAQDNLQICTEKNATSGLVDVKLRINGTSSGKPVLTSGYDLLDEHDYLIDVNAGTTRVYWDDMVNAVHLTTAIVSAGGASAYFKAGCYANADETDDTGTEYMAVDYEAGSFRVWHTGYSGEQCLPLQQNQPNGLMLCA